MYAATEDLNDLKSSPIGMSSTCFQTGKPSLVLLVRLHTEFLDADGLDERLALGGLVHPNDPDHAALEFPELEEEELQRYKGQQHDEEQQRGEEQQHGKELHLEVGLELQEQIYPLEVYASWIV